MYTLVASESVHGNWEGLTGIWQTRVGLDPKEARGLDPVDWLVTVQQRLESASSWERVPMNRCLYHKQRRFKGQGIYKVLESDKLDKQKNNRRKQQSNLCFVTFTGGGKLQET